MSLMSPPSPPWVLGPAPQRARAALRGQLPRPPSLAGGRPTVRQFPTSPDPSSLGMTDHRKGKRQGLLAQAAPSCFRRLARPCPDYRPGRRYRRLSAPLLAPEEQPHQIPHLPDSMAPDAIQGPSGLSSHACRVCVCAGVRRCAIGPCAESPRSARPTHS